MKAASFLVIPFLAGGLAELACAQVSAPATGFVRFDNASAIRTVLGVPGSFVFGPLTENAAEAASFSDKASLVADGTHIELVNRQGAALAEYPYSSPTPVLSLTDEAQSALAWLPGTHTLITYSEHTFHEVEVNPGHVPGVVTSVCLVAPKWASLLLSQTDGSVSEALIAMPEGEIASIDLLPGVTGPAYRFGDNLLWRDDNGLQIESVSGASRRHTLPAPAGTFTAERMSTQWLHLFFIESKSHWALQLDPIQPFLSRLPFSASSRETSR